MTNSSDTPEFIDTYSDDTQFLMQARDAVLTHPYLVNCDTFVAPCICRLFLYAAIGAIEAMVNQLLEKSQEQQLKNYLQGNSQNKTQIQALDSFFRSRGLICNQTALQDLFIMKLLRNEITHASHKEERRSQIKAASFPVDTRELKVEHLSRFQSAYQHIMNGLGMCLAANKVRRTDEYHIEYDQQPCATPSGVISFKEFMSLPWRYLERSAAELASTIERAVHEGAFKWLKDDELKNVGSRNEAEVKEQFYLAAFKAGVAGCKQFKEKAAIAADTLRFWSLYLDFHCAELRHVPADIRKSVVVLGELSKQGHRVPSINSVASTETLWLKIAEHLPSIKGFSSQEVAMALHYGTTVYPLVPNITAVSLFCALCPAIDPVNAPQYVQAANEALDLFELRWQWYALIEHGKIPPADKLIQYRNILSGIEHGLEIGGT